MLHPVCCICPSLSIQCNLNFYLKNKKRNDTYLFVPPKRYKRKRIGIEREDEIEFVWSHSPKIEKSSVACPTYATTENKMSDTFYLVRANSTIGALTRRFPSQTSEHQGKRRIEGAIPDFRVEDTANRMVEDLAHQGIRCRLDCISWHIALSRAQYLLLRVRARALITSRRIFMSHSHLSLRISKILDMLFRISSNKLPRDNFENLSKNSICYLSKCKTHNLKLKDNNMSFIISKKLNH